MGFIDCLLHVLQDQQLAAGQSTGLGRAGQRRFRLVSSTERPRKEASAVVAVAALRVPLPDPEGVVVVLEELAGPELVQELLRVFEIGHASERAAEQPAQPGYAFLLVGDLLCFFRR